MDGNRWRKGPDCNTQAGARSVRDHTLLLLGDQDRGIAIPPKGAFAEILEAAFQDKGSSGK